MAKFPQLNIDQYLEEMSKIKERMISEDDGSSKGKDGQWIYTLFGDGIIDYRPIFRRLKEIDFRGYISAECPL